MAKDKPTPPQTARPAQVDNQGASAQEIRDQTIVLQGLLVAARDCVDLLTAILTRETTSPVAAEFEAELCSCTHCGCQPLGPAPTVHIELSPELRAHLRKAVAAAEGADRHE